ncbi:hypothetical protein LP414_25840 [Polaromonas sp. P1(28)-13]|nr:hypothetical protein LP414_25840 [Polaromonas sp. P1(28)-13]
MAVVSSPASSKGELFARDQAVVDDAAGLVGGCKLDFVVLATFPKAFRHRKLGLVDALSMFKTLAVD